MAALLWAGFYFSPDPLPAGQKDQEDRWSNQAAARLRTLIDAAAESPGWGLEGEWIVEPSALSRFYSQRGDRPAWNDERELLPQADLLFEAIRNADADGLKPADYHLEALERMRATVEPGKLGRQWPNLDRQAALDLLLTDAFLAYASDLISGRYRSVEGYRAGPVDSEIGDPVLVLQDALDTETLHEVLAGLGPPQKGYLRMKEELARYRDLAERGGWPSLSEGPPLKKGQEGERIAILRRRLLSTGELSRFDQGSFALFDERLEKAVRRFQERHGLEADGIVGPKTQAALNVPAGERVRQIELNMERWRWLPDDLGPRHIVINIADFHLDLIEGAHRVLSMRVVAGTKYRQTPGFTAVMTHLVFNPYWHVPARLALEDIIPLIQKDSAYLNRQKIKVFQGPNGSGREVDPEEIDWSKVSKSRFIYRFRQEPGPENPLGRVKFIFPNRFDIYLHDTPARRLFDRPVRDFSSGCIRIEKPIELAEYLLRDDPEWTPEKILDAVEQPKEKIVRLRGQIPVHLVYWTAWVEEDGSVQFRPDLYGRDRVLAKAFRKERGLS